MMKKTYSNLIITFIFFIVVTIIGIFVLPGIYECQFQGTYCLNTFPFAYILLESIFYSSIGSLLLYIILKTFRK